jgi:hypothetical protein
MACKNNYIIEDFHYIDTIYKYGGNGVYDYDTNTYDKYDNYERKESSTISELEWKLTQEQAESDVKYLANLVRDVVALKVKNGNINLKFNRKKEIQRLVNLSLSERYKEELSLRDKIIELSEKKSIITFDKLLEAYNTKKQLEKQQLTKEYANQLRKQHLENMANAKAEAKILKPKTIKDKTTLTKNNIPIVNQDFFNNAVEEFKKKKEQEKLERIKSPKERVEDILERQGRHKPKAIPSFNAVNILFRGSTEERSKMFSKK